MSTEIDTILCGIGLAFLLVGVFLWLGLAAACILLGVVLVFIGVRLDITQIHPDPAADAVKREQHGSD
jgi:fatty acid desaturase